MQLLKTKNKTALAIAGLTTFVIALLLLLDKGNDNKESKTNITQIEADEIYQPDYFMENYNIISTDITGKAHLWLSGKTLQHFPDGNINLTQPTLKFSQKEQDWLLSAEKGTIENSDIEDKALSLHGNVNVRQFKQTTLKQEALQPKTKGIVIQTEHLDILMAKNTASTQDNIKVSDENGVINATGLTIDFNTHQLNLLSNVKGRYVFKEK